MVSIDFDRTSLRILNDSRLSIQFYRVSLKSRRSGFVKLIEFDLYSWQVGLIEKIGYVANSSPSKKNKVGNVFSFSSLELDHIASLLFQDSTARILQTCLSIFFMLKLELDHGRLEDHRARPREQVPPLYFEFLANQCQNSTLVLEMVQVSTSEHQTALYLVNSAHTIQDSTKSYSSCHITSIFQGLKLGLDHGSQYWPRTQLILLLVA